MTVDMDGVLVLEAARGWRAACAWGRGMARRWTWSSARSTADVRGARLPGALAAVGGRAQGRALRAAGGGHGQDRRRRGSFGARAECLDAPEPGRSRWSRGAREKGGRPHGIHHRRPHHADLIQEIRRARRRRSCARARHRGRPDGRAGPGWVDVLMEWAAWRRAAHRDRRASRRRRDGGRLGLRARQSSRPWSGRAGSRGS